MPETPPRSPARPGMIVLDTGAILAGLGPAQAASGTRFLTPQSVRDEVRPGGPTGRSLERQEAAGLEVVEPSPHDRRAVEEAARRSGDLHRLSATDRDVLAVAFGARSAPGGVELWTDDFAVQNVSRSLGLAVRPATGTQIRDEVVWHVRCTGCGRYLPGTAPDGECPVCGSPLKRTRKAPAGQRRA